MSSAKTSDSAWWWPAGSIFGSFIGGRLLGLAPNAVLLPLLAVVLVLSAVKVWRHK